MKLFKDAECTQEITSLDLGTVEAGFEKSYTFYVQNDQKCKLENLEFFVAHKEVSIVSAPKIINTFEVVDFVINWAPSVTIKQGLQTELQVKGYEVYGHD